MVNPMDSRFTRVGKPQGELKVYRAKESGESECRFVMKRIGQYPRRKVADFRMVLNDNSE